MPLFKKGAGPLYQPRYKVVDIEKCVKIYLELFKALEKMKENVLKIDCDR